MGDDFAKDLLTGDGKWWEFLDPQTYEVRADLPRATRSSSDKLDWSRKRPRRGPVGFAYFNHCEDCGQGIPPDFTFCVHCGGDARNAAIRQQFTIVVAKLADEHATEMAAELVASAGHGLDVREVRTLLADLPAVFNVTGPRDQVAALTAKMSEVGIGSRAFGVDDPSVPWIRETAESIIRQTPKFVTVLGVLALGAGLAWLWSGVALVGALVVVGVLFWRELQWYRARYEVRLDVMLQLLTGFDPTTAAVARETLRLMSDRGARQQVTVCLMEYYTLTHQIRAHRDVYGEVLDRAAEALEELMADVLVLAHRYAKLDDFLRANPPAKIRQQIESLRASAGNDDKARRLAAAEEQALAGQLAAAEKMEASRESFREQLQALAQAMESMRVRFAAVRARPSEDAFRELEFEEALRELDEEFEVFEEALAAVR